MIDIRDTNRKVLKVEIFQTYQTFRLLNVLTLELTCSIIDLYQLNKISFSDVNVWVIKPFLFFLGWTTNSSVLRFDSLGHLQHNQNQLNIWWIQLEPYHSQIVWRLLSHAYWPKPIWPCNHAVGIRCHRNFATWFVLKLIPLLWSILFKTVNVSVTIQIILTT